MTDEAGGGEHGLTVAFFFKSGISSDWEHIIYGQSPTLPRILPHSRRLPHSDTRTLPYLFVKIHNFLQNTRNPSKMTLSQSKSKIKNQKSYNFALPLPNWAELTLPCASSTSAFVPVQVTRTSHQLPAS